MKTVNVLRAAKRRIEAYGLTKGDFGSKKQGFCILGACIPSLGKDVAVFGSLVEHLLTNVAREIYPRRFPVGGYGLTGTVSCFNDHKNTRKRDVLRVIDRAIELAKALR